ncbi:MAG: phosphotransferase, partial [SAR202 cluster bacterium]|nr:phosphotransferase [SAR202 cluster bacterium]
NPMTPTDYRKLVEAHFPQVEILTCEPIDMGWDYFVLDVNDELIFRFPRRPDVTQQLEWEMELLPKLADALPVRVPNIEYVAKQNLGDPPMFVGYPKIPGSGLDSQKLEDSGARAPVVKSIADALSALHSIPLDGLSDHPMSGNPDPRSADGWRDKYYRLFEFAQNTVFPRLSLETQRREIRTWQEFLEDDSNFDFLPVLVHQDLNAEHVITDYAKGTVSGIIDWGDCGFGDPALDFVGLADGLGEDFATEVLANYTRPDESIMSRARFYGLVVAYHYIEYELNAGEEG